MLKINAYYSLLQYQICGLRYILVHIGFILLPYLLKKINKICHMSLFLLKIIVKGNIISVSISNSIENFLNKHSIVIKHVRSNSIEIRMY